MTRNEMLRRLETMIEEPPNSVKDTDLLSDFPGWDSITILKFILEAEKSCGIRPAAEDILGCETLNDLMRLVKL